MRFLFAGLFTLVATVSQAGIGLEFEFAPGNATAHLPTNLMIKKGEVIGLIGPSGSGKTTVMRCICLIERSEGEVQIYDLENKTHGRFTYNGVGLKTGAMPNGRFRPGKLGIAFEASVIATGATITIDTGDPGAIGEVLMWLQIMSEIAAAAASMNPELGLSPEGFLGHNFTVLNTGVFPSDIEIDTTGWTVFEYSPTLSTETPSVGDRTKRVVPESGETVSQDAEATSGAAVGNLGGN